MNDSESAMTNNRHQCDELLELIPAYAIGATDADETAFVESALAGCPEARAELAEYQDMVDDLRMAVPQIEPPAALKSRLIAATSPAPVSKPAIPLSMPAPRRRIHTGWIAFAAAMLLLVFTNIFWLTRQSAESQPDALILSQDIAWTRLDNDAGTNSWALMMWNPDSESAVLCAYNFPELPEGQVYQLWLNNNGYRVSGGTFRVNENGFGLLSVKAHGAINGYQVVGVTTEPEGSTEPTGDSVVRGEI